MKKILFFLSAICLLLTSSFAQNFKGRQETLEISPPSAGLKIGETLSYSVEWLGIPVGQAILKVEGREFIGQHECYHLSAQAIPNKFLRRIIDLEYQVHSWLDTQLLSSRRFEKIRRMNKKSSHVIIEFNPQENKAVCNESGDAPTKKISSLRESLVAIRPASEEITQKTQDLLSSFYYFRLLETKPEETMKVNIYYSRRNWEVSLKTGRPFRKDIFKKGTFEVFPVYPESELNDFILGKRGFSVLFSTDSRRIPLELNFPTGIGLIKARLQDLPISKSGKI